jgi:hypothetical protein
MRSPANDGHHAVTVPETSRCSAYINHLAGDFQARNDRVAEVRLLSVESLPLENVGAIQPGRADADQEIVRSQLRNRFFHQLDHVCIACVFKTNCPHAASRNCQTGLAPHIFSRHALRAIQLDLGNALIQMIENVFHTTLS